jgi:hypothetical protein
MTFKSVVPAFLNGARRAAAGPAVDAEPQRPDSLTSIAATVLAVLAVGVIAVLLGMT